MHPYMQDMRVTYRRMNELVTRSEGVRRSRAGRECAAEPVALQDPGELVNVVKLAADDCGCRADERIAS